MQTAIDEADVVVVGGGIIGASAAYHLTKAGINDVLVIERNELASGASARSAGCLIHTRSDASSIKMIQRTRAAVKEMEEALAEPLYLHERGSIRAVFNEARANELLAMEEVMKSTGIQVREINRHEAAEMVPWLELDGATRAIFVPEDGYADGALLTSAYARASKQHGARYRRGVNVAKLLWDDNVITGVLTDDGAIRSKWVVVACGVWNVALAKTLGIGFAGAPTRSHYWITAPDGSGDPSQPNIQLPDMRAYLRSEVGGVLLGMQEPQTRTYDPMTLENDMADMVLEEEEHDLELLYEQTRSLCDVIPKVDEWGFAHHIVGLSMYTPDGKFVIGRPVDSSGLVVAGGCCGSGLAASGGFGQIVADIVSDQPGNIDASIYDPNRFGPVDPTTDEFRKRCAAARSGKSRGNMSEDAA